MEAWATELLSVFRSKIKVVAQAMADRAQKDPNVRIRYTAADLEQFLMSLHAMMAEELDNKGTEALATYMGAVVPSQISQGENLLAMIWYATWNAVTVHAEVVPHISAEHQGPASSYLREWWANYNSEMSRNALQAGWTLP
ncbi:hypothetical protein [Polyangium fumosum]|uniref:Uncharacterized protein n=2 Tax=Polyangium TaxID=55 RepID=A0A4U1JKJ4_9BACT|nr:hypothetical protein [Polyangium fumosum]TKD13155.1 hypothetical protein E8A74_00960 [Polyangium fumosum]